MKKFIGLLGVALAISAPAFAADMPIPAPAYKAPPPPPPPVFSWTGWYIGGNAGYGWASSTNPNIATDPFDSLFFAGVVSPAGGNVFPGLSPSGFIGGGQIGYDRQVNPNFVVVDYKSKISITNFHIQHTISLKCFIGRSIPALLIAAEPNRHIRVDILLQELTLWRSASKVDA